jgi:hypothetical protein
MSNNTAEPAVVNGDRLFSLSKKLKIEQLRTRAGNTYTITTFDY